MLTLLSVVDDGAVRGGSTGGGNIIKEGLAELLSQGSRHIIIYEILNLYI
jgi:hypothetical protein